MESQNLEHGYTKDQCSDHIKILIKILNPIQKLFQPKANHCKAELVCLFFAYMLTQTDTQQNIFMYTWLMLPKP